MKNRLAKSISLLLAVVMLITVVPLSAYGYEYENSWDKGLSASQLAEIESFYTWWQTKFVTENSKVSSKAGEEKQYFILKTIYNFATDNTRYDNDVRDNKFSQDSERFKKSHSIYGALFSNKSWSEYNCETRTDSDGLTRINNTNQGLAVCEGFSSVVQYLCDKNGIPCKTIIGDYDAVAGKTENHAWNVVEIGSKWYYIDATSGKTSLETITDLSLDGEPVIFVDYGYFLRGTENIRFSIMEHQMPDPDQQEAQTKDYVYNKESFEAINTDKAWTIISRRLTTASEREYEDYCVISPENSIYKIEEDEITKEKKLVSSDTSMIYDGRSYFYCVKIQDFVEDIEFTTSDKTIKDAGDYTLAFVVNGEKNIHFTVNPLDMGDINNYKSFTCDGEEIGLSLILTPRQFNGGSIDLSVNIYDKADYKLVKDADYTLKIYDSNGNENLNPYDIGRYTIVLNFNDLNKNYCGKMERSFDIVKGDISAVNIDNSALQYIEYGSNIIEGASTTRVKDLTFENGVDYTVSLSDPSKQDYGDSGYIVYTALASSKYFIEGTKLYRPYTIGTQCDLSAQFTGLNMGKFSYTGSAIQPVPSLKAVLNGNIIQLVNGVDFVVSSYTENVNVGTAYANIQFIGKFKGTASIAFEIVSSSASSSGGGSNTTNVNNGSTTNPAIKINTVESVKYTGKTITPTVTVTANGVTLTAGKDYTVSAISSSAPGVYAYTVKGIGAYSSSINSTYALFIEPGNITGVKAEGSGSAINLSWDAQGGMCSYDVYCYDSAKKKWSLLTTTTKSSYKVSKVISGGKKISPKANTKYSFRIVAKYSVIVNNVTYKKTSPNKDFSAKLIKKSATLKSLKKGNKQLKATWSKYAGASGYTLELSTDKNFKKNKKTVNISKGKTTSSTVKGLKAKKTYYVRIRAYETSNGVKSYSPYSKTLKIKL